MTTTLNKINSHKPYHDAWDSLLLDLGKTKTNDEPLDILTIIDKGEIRFAIWCFRAIEGYYAEIRAFARFCANINVEKIKPDCTEEEYLAITKWLETGNENLRIPVQDIAVALARITTGEASSDSRVREIRTAIRSAARSIEESTATNIHSSEAAEWATRSTVFSVIGLTVTPTPRSKEEDLLRVAVKAAKAEIALAMEQELKRILTYIKETQC